MTGMYMVPDAGNVLGVTWGASPPGTPTTGMGWAVQPDGLLEQLRTLRDRYGNPEVLITENGASYPDPAASGGQIADPQRIAFLQGHIRAAAQACAEGCALRGYFAWTLTDNFEWAEGFGPKFGLVAVDRSTLTRTPKRSLAWYQAPSHARTRWGSENERDSAGRPTTNALGGVSPRP